ncbi:MAG: RND family transporter [Corynebacteriales bacterium]|nr:RND family transporter [Mycobacteriales bacterium]
MDNGPSLTPSSKKSAANGEYSALLERVAWLVMRRKGIVALVWILIASGLALMFPQLESVIRDQSVDPIPASVPSFQTLDRMGTAFDERGAKTTVFVAMENKGGLNSETRANYGELVAALSADREHVIAVRDLLGDQLTEKQALSSDKKAWYLPVSLEGTLGGPEAADAVDSVREIADRIFQGSVTTVRITGPPASFSDLLKVGESDLIVITLATVLMIAAILFIVYRSLFTALMPLLVVGMSLVVGRGVLSGLGEIGMPVSQFTSMFMTVIIFGAGVDYSVFLISRYHEAIRSGRTPDVAIAHANGTIGRVVLASAATVALAFLSMAFAKLSVFRTLGPACAIAIAIGFLATVTLLPAVLSFAAKRGAGLPRKDLTRRYWHRVGTFVVRRPVPLLAVSIVALIALGLVATTMRITYDDREGQPSSTESNEGYALLNRHFPKDTIISEFLVVESKKDMRTAQGLADLDQMASRVAQTPGVTRVVGVTRPTGERLQQAQLSYQNDQIGSKITEQTRGAQTRKDDLNLLKTGSSQLAGGLALLRDQITTNLAPLGGLLGQASAAGGQLAQYRPLVDQLASAAPALDQFSQQAPQLSRLARQAQSAADTVAPALGALDAPWCTQIPQCSVLRTQTADIRSIAENQSLSRFADFATNLGGIRVPGAADVAQLQDSLNVLDTALQTIKGQDLGSRLSQLETGVGALADGARQLSGGVSALVDSNVQLLAGLSQVAAQLRAPAKAVGNSDSATGFYLPADAFKDQTFSQLARQFISPDGKMVRFAVQTAYDPYSADAIRLANTLADISKGAMPNTTLEGNRASVAGFPAINADVQRLLSYDFKLLGIATLLIVLAILMLLLRAIVAPIYLLATVVLNYLAALGMGVLVLQHILGHGISWPVPLVSFIVLVAVGADYNMLLVSRLREETTGNVRLGVLRTVAHTGSVITSAGLIFAASMIGLAFGSIDVMVQIGFVVAVGLLIDTFVVRTLVVPAVAVLLGKASWWPGNAHGTNRGADSLQKNWTAPEDELEGVRR